jgi:hypothetical protein
LYMTYVYSNETVILLAAAVTIWLSVRTFVAMFL